MSRSGLSSGFHQAVNVQNTMEGFWMLLTIEHSDLPQPLRLNDSGANVLSRGNTYLACPFQVVILDEDESRPPQASVALDNIDRTLVAALLETLTPPTVTMEIVRDSDPNTVERSITDLQMKEVTFDALVIQGTLSLEDLFEEPAVDFCFTPSYFPGLF
jgi:hypothetical protein